MKLFEYIEKHIILYISMAILGIGIATSVAVAAGQPADNQIIVAAVPSTEIVMSPTTTTSTTTTTTLPPTTTTTPPTPEEIVNNIVYIHSDPAPAMQAFAIVATARGWSQEQITSWSTFASDVMYRESRYCYNVRRGAVIDQAYGCVLEKQGPYQDSGFAQLIATHYNPGKWLCEQENLCSAEDIISTPWNSMTSFVALLERSGRQPWCYSDSLKALSRCRNAPKNPPAL